MTKGLQKLPDASDQRAATECPQLQQQGSEALVEACQRAAMAHLAYQTLIPQVKVSAAAEGACLATCGPCKCVGGSLSPAPQLANACSLNT